MKRTMAVLLSLLFGCILLFDPRSQDGQNTTVWVAETRLGALDISTSSVGVLSLSGSTLTDDDRQSILRAAHSYFPFYLIQNGMTIATTGVQLEDATFSLAQLSRLAEGALKSRKGDAFFYMEG